MALHGAELLVNTARDESAWRGEDRTRGGAVIDPGALELVFKSGLWIFLFYI
jgi:hypothetical protein